MVLSAATTPFATRGMRFAQVLRRTGRQAGVYRTIVVERKLEELGVTLPPPSKAQANYSPTCHASGNLLFLSGHLPFLDDGSLMKGRIGPESGGLEADEGYQAARQCGLNLLATLKRELGDLDRVEQVVKVFGIVQSTDDFKEQPVVMNGCSDLMMAAFGDKVGYHARSAIGTNSLPFDVSVEIEAIVQIKPEE